MPICGSKKWNIFQFMVLKNVMHANFCNKIFVNIKIFTKFAINKSIFMDNKVILRPNMERRLLEWKNSVSHRPLILEGARQIGKTWMLKYFGKTQFRQTAYFNFESNPTLCEEFKNSKDPVRLIPILELYCGFKIETTDTLIIFDEIQECPEALNSLKYFAESEPNYYIAAAGSLLGVSLSAQGFPVGKVELVKMYPVSFFEFILSSDDKLASYVSDNHKGLDPLPVIVWQRLHEMWREYLICGGLPRVILTWWETRSVDKVDSEIRNIMRSYELDFSKHAPHDEMPKIFDIWRSIPSQLAKENRKFIYRIIRSGARARTYENALMWLQQAGLIYRIFECDTPKLPISAYEDVSAFKVYLFDIGILRVMSNMDAGIILHDDPLYQEFKGAFIENYVLQSLMPQLNAKPNYWTSAGKAEVDFLIQIKNGIVPVEVKSSQNTASKSLAQYIKKYLPKISLVFSSNNIALKDNVLHLPLSCVDFAVSKLRMIMN